MNSRTDVVDGWPVRIFVPDTHEEYMAMTKWCKIHIGRSHGWHSVWYVRNVYRMASKKNQHEIIVKPGPHMPLCLLTWG